MAEAKTNLQIFYNLQEKKDAIESELKELHHVLDTQGVGMSAPLTDQDDFPRADVDIYSVRHARHRVKCLETDHRQVMEEVEDILHKIHADAREGRLSKEDLSRLAEDRPKRPFLLVDRVDEGSPSFNAGLQVGDEVVMFGSVNKSNYHDLQTIGTLVARNKGRQVKVTVLREGKVVEISFTPQIWSGKGLLGCNIVPIKTTTKT